MADMPMGEQPQPKRVRINEITHALEFTTDNGVTWTAAGGGGSSLGPLSQGYFEAFFQQQTALDPRRIASHFDDFTNDGLTIAQHGVLFAGSGATAAFVNGISGGVIQVKCPTLAGGGYADWDSTANTSRYNITNARTKRWMTYGRLAVASAPAAASRVSLGILSGAPTAGIGYAAADANWQYVRGASGPADVTDLGKAINTAGTAYIWIYVANFDLVNVVGAVDYENNPQVTLDVVTNLVNGAARPYFYNEGSNSGDTINLDAMGFCVERA